MNLETDRLNTTEVTPDPSDNGKLLAQTEGTPTPDSVPDKDLNPFDPARFRLTQDFASQLGVKKLLITVPVRKPSREWWVQTHPDDAYWLETAVLELKEDRETYLVVPELWPALSTEASFVRKVLVLTMNRQKVPFLWPIRMPGEDGKLDDWNHSALEAAQIARGRWVRVSADMSLGAYAVAESTADLSAPEWPDEPMSELLRVAFKRYLIEDQDHAVLRKLRGEV